MIRDAISTPADTQTDLAAVTVTEQAAVRLRQFMQEKGMVDSSLRVYVSGSGCSGLQYGMGFVTDTEAGDSVFTSAGLSVVIDPVSMSYLQGATVDYVDNELGGAFKIDNPNAAAGCGCGSGGGEGSTGGCGGGCG